MAGIDYFAILIYQRLDFAAAAYCFDPIAANEQRAVFDDCELAQITTGARPARTRERNNL